MKTKLIKIRRDYKIWILCGFYGWRQNAENDFLSQYEDRGGHMFGNYKRKISISVDEAWKLTFNPTT